MKRYLAILFISISLTGCGLIQPGMEEFTMPEQSQSTPVDAEALSTVERLAATKHVKPELSEEFMTKYLNMDSFAELKERTRRGMEITQNTAEMTEKEFRLWEAIIDSEIFNQYTVEDMEEKKKELYSVLNQLAEEKQKELDEMMKEDFGMEKEETDVFLKKQAEKYVEEDVDD